MTKRRMLAMINTKVLSELPKSVFPKSLKTYRKGQADQHSHIPVFLSNNSQRKHAFHSRGHDVAYNQEDAQYLFHSISKLLYLESQYFLDCSFLFYVDPIKEDKVNSDLRDYTVKSLQILNKVFYEMPTDVFMKAVALIDRFLTRVKVKPKYTACVVTACFYIAAKRTQNKSCPSLESLSLLSKCGGTVQDLERMAEIILSKLNNDINTVTALDFLCLFNKYRNNEIPMNMLKLETFLELSQTSLKVCCQRPSIVALACLLMISEESDLPFIKTMSLVCKLDLRLVSTTAELISNVYKTQYCPQPSSRESLIWAISKRTLSNMCGSSQTSLETIVEEDLCSESCYDFDGNILLNGEDLSLSELFI